MGLKKLHLNFYFYFQLDGEEVIFFIKKINPLFPKVCFFSHSSFFVFFLICFYYFSFLWTILVWRTIPWQRGSKPNFLVFFVLPRGADDGFPRPTTFFLSVEDDFCPRPCLQGYQWPSGPTAPFGRAVSLLQCFVAPTQAVFTLSALFWGDGALESLLASWRSNEVLQV